jgi:hypothetical protein
MGILLLLVLPRRCLVVLVFLFVVIGLDVVFQHGVECNDVSVVLLLGNLPLVLNAELFVFCLDLVHEVFTIGEAALVVLRLEETDVLFEERIIGSIVGFEEANVNVIVGWGLANGVESVHFIVDVQMELENVVFVALEVHAVELRFDTEGLGLCACEGAHGDLFEHRRSIPTDVRQLGHDLAIDLVLDATFEALEHHPGVDVRPGIRISHGGDQVT